ncbi:MAG TPA: Zn-dependent hydrolase [Acetobacteraceae bacterium]|nr:Zn-dependent hydrolase [Acetobacteraceae bacterium]
MPQRVEKRRAVPHAARMILNQSIDGGRLLADLHRLRQFGAYKTGVHRPTYSTIDMQSRLWLMERMRDAGLTPEIDGIGNVIGRGEGEGPRLLLGSHTETQNHAGWLDGALGVMYALEVARTLGRGVDVASWADEEGHYGNFLGSRSFVGELDEAEIDRHANRYHGKTLREALEEAGLAGKPRARFEPGGYCGYLEAHIEQGDELEAKRLRIGVVTSIVGIWQYRISFEGVQNHAGTTRMAIRRDAGLALVHFANEIDKRFPAVAAARSVWTIGRITLDPGAASIVPGGAEMMFQFRDADPDALARMEAALRELVSDFNAAERCPATLHTVSRSTPKVMDDEFQDVLATAAERHAGSLWQRMPSGAGHDAQMLARVMPAGMLFVPSIGGISHHWSEDTKEDDIVLGCQVMADAVAALLARG